MLRIEVKRFGPIYEGNVRLRPLTIFVGPNGSGKSYLAEFIYALLSKPHIFFGGRKSRPIPAYFWLDLFNHPELSQGNKAAKEKWQSLVQLYVELINAENQYRQKKINFSLLPEELRKLIHSVLQQFMLSTKEKLFHEIRRCYGIEVSKLVMNKHESFNITIEDSSRWSIVLFSLGDQLNVEKQELKLEDVFLPLLRPESSEKVGPFIYSYPDALTMAIFNVLNQFFQPILIESKYLPAARSGILQSHKALTSFVVSRAPLAGVQTIEIPKLSGVVTDFITELLRLDIERKSELFDVATFLEEEVVSGRITISKKTEYPEIYYQHRDSSRFRLTLHRTSSMVSELAPVILFLKYIVRPGSLLILEEPEAHLHPACQRKVARALVKLVRKGTNVLITTHSDYLISQLSNFIRLSSLDEKQRTAFGYSPQDYLKSEEVGAYLFDVGEQKGGSVVKELTVNLQEGIPESEFTRIAESLYEETILLEDRGDD
ncbi:AAA family ATPase [Neomoorella mulderi]|uniref:Vitamin B12 import ATP-binding protein BtuD n=1 Tax=Moorella mulderi DSM 14980 TaxID=1122241 RepID=A0A151AYT4_9FIRM|nr:AAA family ATPase [Moorella mulderi]KYH32815.1 vitamin B12 import ATP-binding protein BtuD [Moorella mulderi DSM 14980]